jgi:putative DNA primase/helicase
MAYFVEVGQGPRIFEQSRRRQEGEARGASILDERARKRQAGEKPAEAPGLIVRRVKGHQGDADPLVVSSDPKIREAVTGLAARAPLDYELVREAEAEKLGVRVSALDDAVRMQRGGDADGVGQTPIFQEIEPWGAEVDGAQLLDDLAASVRRFVVLPKHADKTVALWVLFTYLIDSVDTAPLLALLSPEKRCGKTTLLSWLSRVTYRALPASNVSPAAVYRSIEKWCPTLLVDEADSFLTDNEELRGVMNSGHTRDLAFVMRCSGDDFEPRRFSTWCPKVLAMIGKPADTLQDRCIVINLRRRLPNEKVEKLRYAKNLDQMRRQCVRFSRDNAQVIRLIKPQIADTLNDRAADNWWPLLAIAEAAGGDWTKAALESAKAFSGAENEAPGIGTELLADIRKAFGDKDRLSSADLIEALCADPERPWATFHHGKAMTQRQLANRLRAFEIVSQTIWLGDPGSTLKGYKLDQFTEAFVRYIPSSAQIPLFQASVRQVPTATGDSGNFSSVRQGGTLRIEKPLKAPLDKAPDGMTDRNTQSGGEEVKATI